MNIIISDCESGNKFRKNIRSKFEIIIGDKKKSVNLEKVIFNY